MAKAADASADGKISIDIERAAVIAAYRCFSYRQKFHVSHQKCLSAVSNILIRRINPRWTIYARIHTHTHTRFSIVLYEHINIESTITCMEAEKQNNKNQTKSSTHKHRRKKRRRRIGTHSKSKSREFVLHWKLECSLRLCRPLFLLCILWHIDIVFHRYLYFPCSLSPSLALSMRFFSLIGKMYGVNLQLIWFDGCVWSWFC